MTIPLRLPSYSRSASDFLIEEIVEAVWVGRAVTALSVWTYLTFNEIKKLKASQ